MKRHLLVLVLVASLAACGQVETKNPSQESARTAAQMIENLKRLEPLDASFEKRLLFYLTDAEKKSNQTKCSPLFDLGVQSGVKIISYNTKNRRLTCVIFESSDSAEELLPVRRYSAGANQTYHVNRNDYEANVSALMALPAEPDVCLNQEITHEPLLLMAMVKVAEETNVYWFYDFPFEEECEVKMVVTEMLMMKPN